MREQRDRVNGASGDSGAAAGERFRARVQNAWRTAWVFAAHFALALLTLPVLALSPSAVAWRAGDM